MLQTTVTEVFIGRNVAEPSVGVARDRDYDRNQGRCKYHSSWDTNPHRLKYRALLTKNCSEHRGMALMWRLFAILQEAYWNTPTQRFGVLQDDPIMPGESMLSTSSTSSSSTPICCERVVSVQRQETPAICVFANRTKLLVSRFLASYVAIGDDIAFPVSTGDAVRTEILITKNGGSGPKRYLYHVPIGYVSQPKQDKRDQHFVSAEVHRGGLGISMVFLPCEILRDYFYRLPHSDDRVDRQTLYEILRIPARSEERRVGKE